MHPNPRRIAPVILVIVLGVAAGWYFFGRAAAVDSGALTASGTIEAPEVNISPEVGGRVTAVNVAEGDRVEAGAIVVQFDTTLLERQRAQAEAALAAAQAGQDAAQAAHAAATANFALSQAGPSDEQLAVAQTVIDRAQVSVDAAQAAYDGLPEAARDTTNGQALKLQLDLALAGLANAQAQYDLAAAGARPEQLAAAQAQVEAAASQMAATAAQAQAAQAAVEVLTAQIAKLTLTSPVEGVVLARAIEPGEVASPGAILLVMGQLSDLTITVYVPEDRYGSIRLQQSAAVSVDSFPTESFAATVSHISSQAEFTPRNVQTAAGRKTTVYAIRLVIENPDGRLKPGMPADVRFGE